MANAAPLFSYESHIDQRTLPARTLILTVGSFFDAGGTQRLVGQHLTAHLSSHVIGHFDVDQVHDYTGRRPMISFEKDRFHSYQAPEMPLRYCTDEAGNHFLLLEGPEPSLRWEAMAREIERLVDQHGVERTMLVTAIPAPVPHTRPTMVSRFASSRDLLGAHQSLLGSFQMSGSFMGMLSVRLAERGHSVLGLIAHVPHYLAEGDDPSSALAMMRALSEDSGLTLPTTMLSVAAATSHAALAPQIERSAELAAHIAELETQYDAAVAERQRLTAGAEDIPSADEIGRAAEEFLRGLGEESS